MIVLKKILSVALLSSLVCQSAFSYFPMDDDSTLVSELIGFGNATFIKNYAVNRDSVDADFAVGSRTGTFTASRGSSNPATYVDSSGLVQVTTTSNIPRFTSGFYDSTGFVSRPGLIVEGASTNLLQDSYFSQTWATYWRNNGSPSSNGVSTDYVNPYGGGSVEKFISSAQNDGFMTAIAKKPTLAASTTYTASALVRGTGTAKIIYSINGGAALYGSTITLSANSWKLVTHTFTQGGSPAAENIGVVADDGSSTVYTAMIQVEALPFASTFIPTTTAALTRNAETLTYPISGNRTAATESIFMKVTPHYNSTVITANKFLFDSDDDVPTAGADRRASAILASTDSPDFTPNTSDSGSVAANATTDPSAFTSYVVGYTCQHASPYASIYINGSLENSYTAGDWTENSFGTNFYVGARFNSQAGAFLDGIISSIAIFSDAKDATAVAAISNLMAEG